MRPGRPRELDGPDGFEHIEGLIDRACRLSSLGMETNDIAETMSDNSLGETPDDVLYLTAVAGSILAKDSSTSPWTRRRKSH